MKLTALDDGRKLAWDELGTGPPLVLLHGWSMSSAIFAEIAPTLGRRFRLLIPDLPGHGRSDPPGQGFVFRRIASDLDQWLTALDLSETDLVGWSMGGQIALEWAAACPQRIRRLSLVAATPRFTRTEGWPHGLPPGQVRAMARNLKRNEEATREDFFRRQFTAEEALSDRVQAWLAAGVRRIERPATDTALAALKALAEEDQRSLLPGVACPALVLHGAADPIVPKAAGRMLQERLANAGGKVFAGVGHAPFLSRPEETIPLWLEFFR